MLSSSERQVRSAGCMLNTEICKSDNWRCVVELSSGAGAGGAAQLQGCSTACAA